MDIVDRADTYTVHGLSDHHLIIMWRIFIVHIVNGFGYESQRPWPRQHPKRLCLCLSVLCEENVTVYSFPFHTCKKVFTDASLAHTVHVMMVVVLEIYLM